ncbi:SDR family NAD(P)-dependent oxidoreductase [Haliscomenobacter sp.]|uniref:SDR family NAD(P)-dependent oxidoreductase n=1 Tax=Haliscomenobacter sp. TaxID=2717303 RepID=UPI003BAC9FE1
MKKKKIIVIGGSSGIGKAVAEMAAEWGNQVILTSRSLERAEATARAIGSSAIGRALDISDEAQVQAFFDVKCLHKW